MYFLRYCGIYRAKAFSRVLSEQLSYNPVHNPCKQWKFGYITFGKAISKTQQHYIQPVRPTFTNGIDITELNNFSARLFLPPLAGPGAEGHAAGRAAPLQLVLGTVTVDSAKEKSSINT